MKLKDITIGIFVDYDGNIGWVKDLSKNTHGEIVLIVRFSNHTEYPIHPNNLKPLK